MSDNVVAMPGKALSVDQTAGRPNDETVGRLERLLRLAKAGELQCIMYSTLNSDGGYSSGWVAPTHQDIRLLMAETQVNATDAATMLLDAATPTEPG